MSSLHETAPPRQRCLHVQVRIFLNVLNFYILKIIVLVSYNIFSSIKTTGEIWDSVAESAEKVRF